VQNSGTDPSGDQGLVHNKSGVKRTAKAMNRPKLKVSEKHWEEKSRNMNRMRGERFARRKASRAGKAAMGSFGVPFRRFSPSLLPPRQQTHFSDYVVVGLFIEPCDLTQILLRFPNCPARFESPQELSIARKELPRKRPRSSLCRTTPTIIFIPH
jgi:hypothetical protein